MIRTLIQVSSLLLTVEAAIFLASAGFGLSPTVIAKLAATAWNHNLAVAANLARQRADTSVGVWLLLLATVLALGNLLWPPSSEDVAVDRGGVMWALLISAAFYFAGKGLSRLLERSTMTRVREVFGREST